MHELVHVTDTCVVREAGRHGQREGIGDGLGCGNVLGGMWLAGLWSSRGRLCGHWGVVRSVAGLERILRGNLTKLDHAGEVAQRLELLLLGVSAKRPGWSPSPARHGGGGTPYYPA